MATTKPRIITLTVRRLRTMAKRLRDAADAMLLLKWAEELNAQHASTGRTDKSQAARRRAAANKRRAKK